MDSVAEIKARLSIEDLVSEYCQLKRKGRGFVALCPFHNDTKPSLQISPDKGIAYCFACQSGGDIFSFYQKIEGVDFRESIKELAEKTGVDLPKERFTPTPGVAKDEKERIRECLTEAIRFYQTSLKDHPNAVEYVAKRSIPPELLEEFCIGYAPDSFDATYTHLLKAGFSRSEILKAGLGIQKELQEERIYDRFRNRLMFPIVDIQGHPIGFGGRTLGDDDAKYINSPDGPLYNKSFALFGLFHAKEALRKEKSVILVEGYFDVLAYHRLGIKNVVAVSGTALTEQHVLILKRSADRILLSLDADTAGVDASKRAFILCAMQGLDIRSLAIPVGKDPDECVIKAPEALQEAVKAGGVPYLEALFALLKQEGRQKREILEVIMPLLNAITSAVEKETAVRQAAVLLETTVTAITDDLARERARSERKQEAENRGVSASYPALDLLFGLFLTYPDSLPLLQDLLEPMEEKQRQLFLALKDRLAPEKGVFRLEDLPETVREYASILSLYCEEHFGAWSRELAEKEIRKLLRKVNGDVLREKQKNLLLKLKEAKTAGKKLEEEKFLTQYSQVLKLAAMMH